MALTEVSMSVYNTELYSKELEERVEELEEAVEKALEADSLEQVLKILKEVA
jgi:hypothetical protein